MCSKILYFYLITCFHIINIFKNIHLSRFTHFTLSMTWVTSFISQIVMHVLAYSHIVNRAAINCGYNCLPFVMVKKKCHLCLRRRAREMPIVYLIISQFICKLYTRASHIHTHIHTQTRKASGSVRADSFLYKHTDNTLLSCGRLFVFLSNLYFAVVSHHRDKG